MKKYRNITIDGDESWAWTIKSNYYNGKYLIIWKDKVRVCEKSIRNNKYPITPGLVSRFIKIHLI